jgi:acetylornithine deacetylase/succinyl-diaminopimelate desuccinylase-like protein
MAALLASMKDDDGRVTIPGYYDGIEIDAVTRRVLSAVPDDADIINRTIGIAEPEKVGSNYQESLQYPSLNVRGFAAAWTGPETRTIVPESAVASIDIRLVPESDPDRLTGLVRQHIEQQGYYVIEQEPTEEERARYSHIARFEYAGATLPFRTDMDSRTGNLLRAAMAAGLNEDPVDIRIMGGTVPTATFINGLDIPAVIVPLVNSDNNQHSPNENLRVGNITNGIATFASILTYGHED